MFLFTSCKDCSQCERDLKATKSDLKSTKENLKVIQADLAEDFNYSDYSRESYDFCNNDKAIIGRREHNTRTGIANFTIPIPFGSHLKLVKKDKNYLLYECYGKIHSDLIVFENKQVSNLTKKESGIVKVEVIFKNYSQRCNVATLQEKKKTAEIQGDPIVSNN